MEHLANIFGLLLPVYQKLAPTHSIVVHVHLLVHHHHNHMLEMIIFVNQAIHLTLKEELKFFNILMTHSGMGRDVTQRVSVVAMLILLLGLGLIFLMKQTNILKYILK